LSKFTCKEKRFLLAHSFGGLSHNQLAPLLWAHQDDSMSWSNTAFLEARMQKEKQRKGLGSHNPLLGHASMA
jgi:hypothetical protein